ncbi:prephenate dehydrogenase [Clostridium sp. 19966]|uniref:prephenate dehydrogenase n=1 Tax=Clostridium sp. 19966 TaxID=2768166 RepID=UPI0028DEC1A1|nr:prephenate dehydrogenase [Clostridium sp. 19966]MDT8716370.1 prephenate dehydrogenase [Clostridium sp. 19966]
MDLSGFNVTIVGLGLIGGSIALSLKKLNPNKIWAIDNNRDTLNLAISNKVISDNISDSEKIKKSDLVVICLYPNDTVEFIKKNIHNFKSNAIITDVSGMKENLIKEINSIERKDINFIGGHPMAGKEVSGFQNADANLFKDCNYFIVPSQKSSNESIELYKQILVSIGCKKVINVDAADHDKLIAYISHLPHIIAVALINADTNNLSLNNIIGGSFKDATRVADINARLWSELFMDNKKNIIPVINDFITSLAKIKNSLEKNDVNTLECLLNSASQKRKEIKK